MGKIEQYLPKPKGDTKGMQANVDTELFESVDKYRKKKELTWNELVTALFLRLKDEEIK